MGPIAMRTTRLGFSAIDLIPEALRVFLARRAAEVIGLVLVVAAIGAALALATWSVRDPSINHATEMHARNALGFPGAITADLLMQLFGLGSIVWLAIVAVWGWKLLAGQPLPRRRARIMAGFFGALAACALFSGLPATERWPLPTGLGGVVGDLVFRFPAAALKLDNFWSHAVWGIALFTAALLLITLALRSGVPEATDEDETPTTGHKPYDGPDLHDEPTLAIVSLGALAHAFMTTRAGLRRQWARFRDGSGRRIAHKARELVERATSEEDPLADISPGVRSPGMRPSAGARSAGRREPVFASDGVHAAAAAAHDQLQAVEPEAEPEPDMPVEPARADTPSSRVTVPAPAIRPSKRIERESQPSLLDNDYQLPPLTLLAEPKKQANPTISTDALEQNARLLEGVLEDFGVRGEIINVRPGPVVTLYELEPAPGIKSSRVIGLADDIARSMSAISARVAVVQGRNAIGIELPNQKREMVYFRELLASQDFENSKFRLPIALGKTIGGEPVIVELARMPHLLIAGTTGSGKSVAINTMILSLLYRLRPEQCRLIMIDPKMLELSVYDGIPHLLTPVVTDPKKAVLALKWAVREMEDRYKKMSKVGVRNIDGFNARVAEARAKGEVITRTVQTGFDKQTGEAIYESEEMDLESLPYIVVLIDEMADLMMVAGKDIEGAVQRLAQMARAAGIHVIMATQRPSVDVITGTIKANFPTRISFQVTSKIDSRTILGEMGAEQLLGQGDMLHMAGGGRISRVHGPFCSDDEVEKVVAHLKKQGRPQYLDSVLVGDEDEAGEDEDGAVFDKGSFGEEGGDLYDQAVRVVLRDKKCSTSYIQRRLQIGYNRAASLVERMEKEGIVGAANHAGKREILMHGTEVEEDA
jgi:S-DNA-T family DNA segregation ATPase FtsK/SpoIIIE